METDRYSQEIPSMLKRLDSISKDLQGIATLVVIFTGVNIGLLLLLPMVINVDVVSREEIMSAVFTVQVALFIGVAGLLYVFDRRAKWGDMLYQDISDEVEWNPRSSRRDYASESRKVRDTEIPGLDIRVAFRQFLFSTDLPFVRGAAGVAAYFFVNLLAVIVSMSVVIGFSIGIFPRFPG